MAGMEEGIMGDIMEETLEDIMVDIMEDTINVGYGSMKNMQKSYMLSQI